MASRQNGGNHDAGSKMIKETINLTAAATWVFPRATLYCPMVKRERDGNDCAACRHYGGHQVSADGDDPPPAFYVNCRFPG